MKVPKFEIVKKGLLDYIGKMPADQDYLPYESELEKMFKVSKRTVRRALLDLRNDGLIDTGRKRGSRVIRDREDPLLQAASANLSQSFLNGACVASLLYSDREGPERTSYLPWQIAGELEARIAEAGGRSWVHNLRESKWANFNDVVDSLKEADVEWVCCFLHGPSNHLDLRALVENDIKPVVYLKTLSAIPSVSHMLATGVDWIATNHLAGIYDALLQDFANVDFVLYVGGDNDLSWERPRIDAVRHFTDRFNIPMNVELGRAATKKAVTKLGSYQANRNCAVENSRRITIDYAKQIKRCRHPLLIGANDVYASGIVQGLDEVGLKTPKDVEVIGYDNSVEAMQSNVSSFHEDQKEIADVLFELCRTFYLDKKRAMQQSHARTVVPSLFKRTSTR